MDRGASSQLQADPAVGPNGRPPYVATEIAFHPPDLESWSETLLPGDPLVVDDEDLDELLPIPPGVVHCRECTILIGPGYIETEPFSPPDGSGVVCFRCFESLIRQADRHARAERNGPPDPPRGRWDPRQRR